LTCDKGIGIHSKHRSGALCWPVPSFIDKWNFLAGADSNITVSAVVEMRKSVKLGVEPWEKLASFEKPLSDREMEVILLSSEGLTDKEIAVRLEVSLGTVHTYWTRIRQKSKGKTRTEMVSRFLQARASVNARSDSQGLEDKVGLFDLLPMGVLRLDKRGVIREGNRSGAILLGLPEAEFKDFSILTSNLPASVKNLFARILSTDQMEKTPMSLTMDNGLVMEWWVYTPEDGEAVFVVKLLPSPGAVQQLWVGLSDQARAYRSTN
jgi:DNA-binding CsgD family transcriptional regulator